MQNLKKKKKKKMMEDLFKVLEHTKTDNPHVPPMVQDAETIEEETKKATNDFIKTVLKFNETDMAATRQKKEDYYDKLFDDITDEDDRRQVIDDEPQTEDISTVDDYLFDSTDEQETKNICDHLLIDVDQNDALCKELLKPRQAFERGDKRLKNLSEKIKKEYQKQRQKRRAVKIASKKAINKLKKANYLQTNDDETVHYNNGMILKLMTY